MVAFKRYTDVTRLARVRVVGHSPQPAVWALLLLWAAVIVALSINTAQAAGSSGSGRMGPVSVPTSTMMASSSDGGLVGTDFSSHLDFSTEAACDPDIQSCKPPDGGGGGGGSDGDCPKWKQDLGLCKPGDGGGGTCGPGPGGPPDSCSTGPSNSPGGAGGSINVGGGNPVNLITGNKYQTEIDLPALPGVLGLELTRHYNAMGRYKGLTGSGWRTSYEAVLYDFGALIQITQADGRRITFDRVLDAGNAAHGTLCTASQPADGQVTIHPRADGKNEYRWRWTDGRVLTFSDGSGGGYPLQSIRAASGEMLGLTYAPKGELVRVRDPQGRSLDFVYDKQVRLQAIVTPASRIEYSIDSIGRLTQVSIKPRQDGPAAQSRPNVRRYHYEDRYNAGWKNVLTGISAVLFDGKGQASEQRLSTYAYDTQGRAILTTKGRPKELVNGQPKPDTGIEQVELKYEDITAPAEIARLNTGTKDSRPRLLSKTTLTNATGQHTEIISAVIGGHYRLLSMKGPGCSTCGPSNQAYEYDAAGRLLRTTQLDAKGQLQRSSYERHDGYGRLIEQGVKASAVAAPRWQMRYRYRDVKFKDGSIALGQQPIVIAQPSVVPGRQWLTRLEYNNHGQVLKVTDEAWSPAEGTGQPTDNPAQATAIRRSTTFVYATIDSRSVLQRIDGPLPNGPANSPLDSDITEVAWNPSGDRITRVVYPLQQTARLAYDDATGWLKQVTGPSGSTNAIEYDVNGQPIRVRRIQAGKVIADERRQHDAFGRLVQASSVIDGQEHGQVFNQYDIAGRLLMQANAQGVLQSARYDAEGRLLASTVTSPTQTQQERYGYDEAGRLIDVEDSTGAVRHLLRNIEGHVTGSVDPMGRVTQYVPSQPTNAASSQASLNVLEAANTGQPRLMTARLNRQGRLSEVRLQGDDGKGQIRSSETGVIHDDFGQVVAVQSDDTGLTLHRYNAAGQLIGSRDSKGSVTEIEYDAAGSMIRRRTGNGDAHTVTYGYSGTQLVEVQDAVQREQLRYDTMGRLMARMITITPPAMDGPMASASTSPSPITATTTYRYNERSELIAQGLPDGTELQYERNAQGQVVALHHQRLPALDAGFTRRTLATGLLRDATGKSRFTYGNGVEANWQRSEQGVLARVLYRVPNNPQATGLRAAIESWIRPANAAAQAVRAQAPAPAASASVPGALAIPEEPRALYDSRLLYDESGNVILIRDSGAVVDSGKARQTHYAYDGLNQLVQAWQDTLPATDASAPGTVKVSATSQPTAVWRYHQDGLGNRLIAQDQQGSKQGPLLQMADKPDSSEAIEPSRDPKQPNRHWHWNADGTLAAVMQTAGASEREIASYYYNHQGLRVAKTVNPPDGSSYREYTLYDTQRHRIADLDAQGRITRQYVWIDELLIAVIDAKQPAAPASVDPDTAQTSAWSNVWDALFHASRIAYVHSNHLGSPVAATDENAKPIWRASYSPYGQRLSDTTKISGSFDLALRLPGQWEDAETGLHYNDQRYYDPAVGRYISADPLGLDGGFNAHAYVGNNPLGFTDPLGLVLFAFDGTDNTTDAAFLARKGSSESNVVEFRRAYQSGKFRYISGVGTDHIEPTGSKYKSIIAADYTGYGGTVPDIGGNYSGKARIERMVEYFSDEARAVTDKTQPMDIDIVGFSRGAAQARDFANRLVRLSPGGLYKYKDDQGQQVCQQLNFRFMGLFDTVLSQNEPSYRYTLGIPLAFQYVAQAVALNEYRSRVTASTLSATDNFGFWDDTRNHIADQYHYGWFALESITGSGTPNGKVRNELGFLGAHADIGGSYGPGENQLSLVALSWMAGQAQIAGVKMSAPKAIDMNNPIVHDQSNAIRWGSPIGAQPVLSRHLKRYGPEDREVRGACNPDVSNGPCKGGLTTQRQMRFDFGNGVSDNRSMTNADTHPFIDYTWRDPKDQPAILYKGTNNVANPNSVSSLRNHTGTVKMDDYMSWLRGHGYVFYGEW